MAAFSNYQQQYYPAVPFVTDSFLEPDTISNNMCCFSTDHDGTGFSSYFPDSHQQIPLHDDHQIHESNTTGPPLHKSYAAADATTAMTVELGTSDGAHPVEKKRKNMNSNSMVEKEGRDGKCSGSILRSTHGEERRRRFSKKQKKVAPVEVPSGYVHVRARRGHATDSHSLAERVRRQKISVRMKLLQSLVPGCDKMTGKALILDEIIRYVRTLQSRVQVFLAAKVSSFSPMLNDFELMDFNTNYPLPQEQLPPVMESSSTRLLNHQEQSSNVTFQDNCNLLWGIDDSRIQEFENQYGLHNLHSF